MKSEANFADKMDYVIFGVFYVEPRVENYRYRQMKVLTCD